MTESLCLNCHTRCAYCAPNGAKSTDLCFCDELQRGHVELFHSQTSQQWNPQPASVNALDEWGGDQQLDFADYDLLYGGGFEQPSIANGTTNLALPEVVHSVDFLTNDPQPQASVGPGILNPSLPMILAAVPDNDRPSNISSCQDSRPAQSGTSSSTRRRDYTKEEKEAFEQWITNNPRPNRAQRVRYAQMHGLVKSQVDNLINNRKRDIRRAEKGAEKPSPTVDDASSAAAKEGGSQFQADLPFESESRGNENEMDFLSSPSTILGATRGDVTLDQICGVIHPVSEENLRSLNDGSSYHSVDEYLNCNEDGVSMESIQLASQKVLGSAAAAARAKLPRKKVSKERLDMGPIATCCLCKQMFYFGEIVVLPCMRRVHKSCMASYLDLWTSKDECPVCRQGINEISPTPCPTLGQLPSPSNFKTPVDDQIQELKRQIQSRSPIPRRTSQPALRRNYSVTSLRRRPTAHGSVASSVASGRSGSSSARSYASSASRTRAKKMRREKHTQAAVGFTCSFCTQHFKRRDDMLAHEIDEHCLPQTFPCTFCHLRFDSPILWEDHETMMHCEPQSTWFCMLEGDIDMEKCVFCEDILPDANHYKVAHFLNPCKKPLLNRTFTTKQYLMGHLIEVHGMTEEEISPVADELRFWALKLNVKNGLAGSIWCCGYCGKVDADWDNRIGHIIDHWGRGGPRFTKLHRWTDVELEDREYGYIKNLASGHGGTRPRRMYFDELRLYEAALKYRANSQGTNPSWKILFTNAMKFIVSNNTQSSGSSSSPSLDSIGEINTSRLISPKPLISFFSSLDLRRKSWFDFTKQKRRQKCAER